MEMKANRKQRERTHWKVGPAGLGSRPKASEQEQQNETDGGQPVQSRGPGKGCGWEAQGGLVPKPGPLGGR